LPITSRSNGAHDHGAVVAQHGDGVLRAEMQPAEQVVKITEADRACDHAEKAAVSAGNAPAEDNGISAAMQHRTADEQAHIGVVAMNLEELLVAAILLDRIQRRGVDGHSPFGVEYLDCAEMLRGRGTVEQNQMPDRLADVLDLRHPHGADDGTQRQVVKLDVAADVGVDTGCKVVKRLARQFFLAVAHVEHDAGADRGEADHRHHRGSDQQLC
jgi:hypothetical protein